MRRRKSEMVMGKGTHSMDTAHGSVPDNSRMDLEPPVTYIAAKKRQGNIMDISAYGMVQITRASIPVRKGI
jgi:hypothetical protein